MRSETWLPPEMMEHSFSLVPFPDAESPAISVSGTISREGNMLFLQYWLAGETRGVALPGPAPKPGRMDDLWKATCFEFFLAKNGQPEYWEFNLSPSGNWNVYRMDAYRRAGFRTEPLVPPLGLETQVNGDVFTLTAAVDLKYLFRTDEAMRVAIAAVIQTNDGRETYWALAHPGPQADFHLRESFTLVLEGQTCLSPLSAPGG